MAANPSTTSATDPSGWDSDQWSKYFKSIGLNYGGDNEIKPEFNKLVGPYSEQATQNAFAAKGFNTGRLNAIQSLIDLYSPSGDAATQTRLQNGAFDTAARAQRLNRLSGESAGLGSGAISGGNAAIADHAAGTSNDIARYMASPEYHMGALHTMLGAYGAGMENPAMQMLMTLYPDIFQSQQYLDQSQQNRGFGGVVKQVAPIIGAYAGSQTGGAAGGGGGYQPYTPIGGTGPGSPARKDS